MQVTRDRTLGWPSFRTLSFATYLCTFGALWGFATFGYTFRMADGTDNGGLLYVWIAFALVGSCLMFVKNRMVANRGLRTRISVADLGVIFACLVLIAVLPAGIGMVKGFALLAVLGIYYVWYTKLLDAQHVA
jgi:hypothetical protein